MDPGVRSPLVDFFRRGEVARDIRLVAARGALAPRALEQLSLLLILSDDADPEIARAADETLERLPVAALSAFLARPDVPSEMTAFFAARGVAAGDSPPATEDPLIDEEPAGEGPGDGKAESQPADLPAAGAETTTPTAAQLAGLSVMQKMKVAMRGTREARTVLIRDPNRLVAAAVLSSPKLTESEIEGYARMANVGEEVLRVIAMNRSWTKNYGVVASLVRNPKTPVAISLNLLRRINDRDVKMLAVDRNIPEPLRIAARNRAAAARA